MVKNNLDPSAQQWVRSIENRLRALEDTDSKVSESIRQTGVVLEGVTKTITDLRAQQELVSQQQVLLASQQEALMAQQAELAAQQYIVGINSSPVMWDGPEGPDGVYSATYTLPKPPVELYGAVTLTVVPSGWTVGSGSSVYVEVTASLVSDSDIRNNFSLPVASVMADPFGSETHSQSITIPAYKWQDLNTMTVTTDVRAPDGGEGSCSLIVSYSMAYTPHTL